MNLPLVILGIILLIAGRKLFWLCVGAVGFVAALHFAQEYITLKPEWVLIVVALVVGILGALLAILVQKIAIVAGGFVLGGGLVYLISERLGASPGHVSLILVIIGGIIGAIVLSMIFEWALIVISSLAGSYLVVNVLTIEPVYRMALFAILTIAGLIIQIQSRSKPRSDRTGREKKEMISES